MSFGIKSFAISCLIVTILGVQAYIGFTRIRGTTWPFVSYPMYAWAKQEGERLEDYSVTAVFADGTELPDYERVIDTPFWILRENFVLPIARQELDADAAREAARVFCGQTAESPVRLELIDTGVSVGRHGAVYGEPQTVGTVDLACR